ncbi:MAG: 16S rRNA (cytidine(1402)-2'-O)-methyltransferase [Pseudomonadota bacterium]
MQSEPPPQSRPETAGAARRTKLASGLYFVATPIGAARDITLRALDILLSVDAIAAEDTRTARRLMDLHGIPLSDRPLIAYHDHNGPRARPAVLARLAAGESVAYLSEAGTPLVADPGFQLAREAVDAGHLVTSAPGASAAIMALTVAGLPSDRFLFAGFPPPKAGDRKAWLAELAPVRATMILYESPKRIHRLLGELCEVWGAERPVALCRELTKRFEEVRRGTLQDVLADLDGVSLKGEIVLVVGRGDPKQASDEDLDTALRAALRRSRVKEASAEVAEALGLPRRDVYQRALNLKGSE